MAVETSRQPQVRAAARVTAVDATAYTIPTDAPESDGTFEWNSTTIVVVWVRAGDRTGIGFSYTHRAAADLIRESLAPRICGRDAMDVEGAHVALVQAVRNVGRDGLAATAIAAVDVALWDLKARLLDVALVTLLGGVRDAVPVYGSGGFTSYSVERLERQLAGWVAEGMRAVKMKIGRDAAADRLRVAAARQAIGPDADLFVDANGAYDRKEALAQAAVFTDHGVSWFEEPVTSDDLDGLRLIRDRAPLTMDIAAGEYGYDIQYFRRMIAAGAVDVLQADATRCTGITGFLQAGVLCDAWSLPLSAHTAPTVHAHVCCAVPRVRHLEYFHDHARIEQMLLDGALTPVDGSLRPDRSRPGLGVEFRKQDAEQWKV